MPKSPRIARKLLNATVIRSDGHVNQLILTPSADLLPAPLFAPTPKAAQRFVEFFTAQI